MNKPIRHSGRAGKRALILASVMVACVLSVRPGDAAPRRAKADDLVSHRIIVLTTDPGQANLDPGYIDPAPGEYVVAVNGTMLVVNRRELDGLISNGFFMQGDLLPNYESCTSDGGSSSGGPGYGDRWIWEHEYIDHIRNGGILGFLTPEGDKVYFYYADYAQHMSENGWWGC